MAYNGSGTFSRLYTWVTDRNNTIKIRSDRMDAEFDGIATALSSVICRDGQSTISADIPFNNKKITGLADAAADTDALNRQTADARYQRNADDLTNITDLADGDELTVTDATDGLNKAILWSAFKADLLGEWQATGTLIPTGTRCPFQQTTPPTGYTKETGATYNDAVSKFTTGTASTGGSQSFATTFASRTFTGTVGNTSLTEANLASHDHFVVRNTAGAGAALSGANYLAVNQISGVATDYTLRGTAAGVPNAGLSSSTGSGTAHTHSLVMDAANFATKYVELTIGVKT